MRVDLLTREYPPEVYGGAGVHVAELVRALRRDLDVVVRCFGAHAADEVVDVHEIFRAAGARRRRDHFDRRVAEVPAQ